MPVKTLSCELFEKECKNLYQKVLESNYKPNLIVAIATGGVHVVHAMGCSMTVVKTLRLSRKSTLAKKKLNVASILSKLPYCMTNFLRKVESFWLSKKKRLTKQEAIADIPSSLLSDINALAIKSTDKLLIVDDAVDSGVTLFKIVHAIKKCSPSNVEIKSAAISVTTPAPMILPDFYLSSCILYRFPWSDDYNRT